LNNPFLVSIHVTGLVPKTVCSHERGVINIGEDMNYISEQKLNDMALFFAVPTEQI